MTTIINSFFMPHVYMNISEEFIAKTFDSLDICIIERIEKRPQVGSDGHEYYSCFVFVHEWYNSTTSFNFYDKLVNNKNTRLVYADPWYWNICMNTSEVASYPMPKHMDLEFVTHADTSIQTIEMVFNALDLGKIHSIEIVTGELSLKAGRDYICPNDFIESPWCVNTEYWKSLVDFKKVMVKVHYEYWYRTLSAMKFQSCFYTVNEPCATEHWVSNLHVPVPVYNGLIWKVFKSSTAPITNGANPYIWMNPISQDIQDSIDLELHSRMMRATSNSNQHNEQCIDETEDYDREMEMEKREEEREEYYREMEEEARQYNPEDFCDCDRC